VVQLFGMTVKVQLSRPDKTIVPVNPPVLVTEHDVTPTFPLDKLIDAFWPVVVITVLGMAEMTWVHV
jgi:hypothetical protein